MGTYTITIDEHADRRLHKAAAELGRSVEDLIESAAEESANEYFRYRSDDPARAVGGARS